jgi:Cdc6-like AAA superfamily ATPase
LSQEIKNDTAAITSRVELIQESQGSEQYRVVMDWLSSTDFPAEQTDIIARRQEGTGKWFVESPEFTSFLEGENKTLFCPGIPGAGKTMISAIAIDYIWKAFRGDNVGVAYIYNNYNRQEEQTATKLVAAILKQLVQGRPLYGETVTALHKQHAGSGTHPSLKEICTSLNSVLISYSKVYIVIDALDEYTNNDHTRSELIELLCDVQTSTNTSLMVTSRFGSGTKELFQEALEVEIQANEADVKQYVAARLDRFPKFVRNDKALQAEIQDGIVQAVDRM